MMRGLFSLEAITKELFLGTAIFGTRALGGKRKRTRLYRQAIRGRDHELTTAHDMKAAMAGAAGLIRDGLVERQIHAGARVAAIARAVIHREH